MLVLVICKGDNISEGNFIYVPYSKRYIEKLVRLYFLIQQRPFGILLIFFPFHNIDFGEHFLVLTFCITLNFEALTLFSRNKQKWCKSFITFYQPFFANKSDEKINTHFVTILASFWNVFSKFCWDFWIFKWSFYEDGTEIENMSRFGHLYMK